MARQYTQVQALAEEVFCRKAAGETNREIAQRYGLTKKQIKELVSRENRKRRKIENGIPRKKGRPRKTETTPEISVKNELAELRMTVDLLRNFLSEVGRR